MRQVLVVVDMQNDFLLPQGTLSLGHDTTAFVNRVAARVRGFDGPVILIRDMHDSNDCEFAFFPPHCMAGTNGSEIASPILEAVKGKTFIMLEKKSYTSHKVSRAIVDAIFRSGKPVPVHVAGICTHICVSEITADIVNTAKNLHNAIPEIHIDPALVDDFNPEMASYALRRLQSLYGVKLAAEICA